MVQFDTIIFLDPPAWLSNSSGVMEDEDSRAATLPWEEIVRKAVHDMRSPLTSMRMAVEVLRLTVPETEASIRLLEMLNRQMDLLTDQMKALAENPASFSK